MVTLGIFIDNPCGSTKAMGSTQPLREMRDYFLDGKCGWWIGLTTLPTSCTGTDCLEMWEPHHPIGTFRACLSLQRECFAFTIFTLSVALGISTTVFSA
jgi:hypothetical protein